jgi:hypothetical protein
VVRATPRGVQVASRRSFAGTILADAGVRQARSARTADVVVRDRPEVWWSPGGVLAARAALADLERNLSS